jgi:hypothetical protein
LVLQLLEQLLLEQQQWLLQQEQPLFQRGQFVLLE